MTTRSIKMVTITQTVQPDLLKSLNEHQSWYLTKKMAFVEGKELNNASFVEFGK